MTEEEYYISNRDKIKDNDISTWKYYPVGELRRKIYDYHHLNLKDFLLLYYKEFEKQDFWAKNWMSNIILPLITNDSTNWKRYDLDPTNKDYKSWFEEKHNIMLDNFKKNKSLFFEEDIIMFISYLETFGFFKDIDMSIDQWLTSKKINSGGKHKTEEDIYTLQELAKEQHGNNLIRDKLMSLEWHKK
jgi:hypothetical protein